MRHALHEGSTLILGILLLFTTALQTSAATLAAPSHALVKVVSIGKFGPLLVTTKGFALYTWTREKPGQIKCTGSCAKVWPPLLVPVGTHVPATVAGTAGRFGIIVRPGKARQLSYNGRALYTFMGDVKPGQVLCDGVQGWVAVRVKTH
jgi:predicted lipoprotein with Yx(FWY)xxD motif